MKKFQECLHEACVYEFSTEILEDNNVYLTQSLSYAVLSADQWTPVAILTVEDLLSGGNIWSKEAYTHHIDRLLTIEAQVASVEAEVFNPFNKKQLPRASCGAASASTTDASTELAPVLKPTSS